MSGDLARERGWWVDRLERTEEGEWDVEVAFLDGHHFRMILAPSRDLDLVIAAGVKAHLRNDRRWHPLSGGGGG